MTIGWEAEREQVASIMGGCRMGLTTCSEET